MSQLWSWVCSSSVFPGSIAKGSSSKSGCQLHLPTSHANLSRVTSLANFSCQLVESYFTCQLLMPTCRELLHLPTSHVNFLRVTSPANFSCQLFGCYLILLKAQANLSGVTSLGAHAAVQRPERRGGAQRHRGARLHETHGRVCDVTFWDNDAGSKIHLLAGAGRGTASGVSDAAGQPAIPSPLRPCGYLRNIDIGLRHSFIAGFPTERVPKMPLSGVSTRSGDLPRFTFKGLDGTMTDLFIPLVAYQLVTLSGTGVSVLDQKKARCPSFLTLSGSAQKNDKKRPAVPLSLPFLALRDCAKKNSKNMEKCASSRLPGCREAT